MTVERIKPLLSYMAQYIDLGHGEIALLASRITFRKYLKGQYIVQQGDICKHENFVLSGCLRTFHVDKGGVDHTVMFAVENWWTADLGSFLTQSPADFNVQCMEDSEVVQFSFENLEQLYLEIPKLERFFRKIIQKAYVASDKRLISNYSLPAKDRYLRFRQQYPEIEQRVPQYMVASYLGITKEFLSKLRNQMANEKSDS